MTTAKVGKLTPKQERFVEAYIENKFNATQAAITAGYSKKTAMEQGYKLVQCMSSNDSGTNLENI